MIPAEEVMLTDDEIDAVLAAAAQQNEAAVAAEAQAAAEQARAELENQKIEMQVTPRQSGERHREDASPR